MSISNNQPNDNNLSNKNEAVNKIYDEESIHVVGAKESDDKAEERITLKVTLRVKEDKIGVLYLDALLDTGASNTFVKDKNFKKTYFACS